jgi:hypothetical protein
VLFLLLRLLFRLVFVLVLLLGTITQLGSRDRALKGLRLLATCRNVCRVLQENTLEVDCRANHRATLIDGEVMPKSKAQQ